MKRWIPTTVGLLICALAGAAFGRWLKRSGVALGIDDPLLLAAVALPAAFLVILWHEAGHLIGGWLTGFKPRLLGVGPMLIRWRDGRPALGFNRYWELWGGFASVSPERRDGNLAWFIAGGPIASLMLTTIALVLPWRAEIAWTTAILSGFITVGTLQPWGAGAGLMSDGGRLLMLRRGGPEAERWQAIAILGGLNLDGVRPRDWPAELVAKAALPGGGVPDRTFGLLQLVDHAWDRGDEAAVQAALDELLSMREQLSSLLAKSLGQTERLWAAWRRQEPAVFARIVEEIGANKLAASTGSYCFYRELSAH